MTNEEATQVQLDLLGLTLGCTAACCTSIMTNAREWKQVPDQATLQQLDLIYHQLLAISNQFVWGIEPEQK